ncbi:MAG: ATP-binding protein [Porcipelethomonas sp.]
MKRKISMSMCCIAALSVIITSVLISLFIYNKNYERFRQYIKNEAEYMAAAMENDYADYLNSVKDVSSSRITWIGSDGMVIYDNKAKNMENHSDRPEFIEAIETGRGSGARLSKTLREKTYYYAVRLSDGTVLRVSDTTSSIYNDIFQSLPYVIAITVVIVIAGLAVSKFQTMRIVRPINEMDLDNISESTEYEELSPLISRLEKQDRDIKNYISRLKAKTIEFETVTENMSEGLIITNNHEILSCNKSALKILCREDFDFHNKNILDLNHSQPFISAVESAFHGEHSEKNIGIENRSYMIMANPVTENDTVKGVVILLVDITEKISREELRREFSANVSHELKTPLTTISGYAEIMKSGWAKPEDYIVFAEKIYNEGQRLIHLIEDIIKLSRLDENNDMPEKENVNLLEIAEDAVMCLRPEAERRGISIDISGKDTIIRAISHIIYEMIFNLCDNAIKYNHENGYVNITVDSSASASWIRVADSGIGIPAEDLDRVFERFYRVDKSHSRETGGTGLGLSIVKHGAALHNAEISVSSSQEKGTEITLTFKNEAEKQSD